MSAIKELVWQQQEEINETAQDGSDRAQSYQTEFTIGFSLNGQFDSDQIWADGLECAKAIARDMYGDDVLLVEAV